MPNAATAVAGAVSPAPVPGVAKAPLLSVNNIEVVYNDVILVLRGLSLEVPEGEIVALLGANGAGKSTTLKAISGLLKTEDGEVTRGDITFAGERINGIDPDRIVRKGIFQVMEGRRIVADMTPMENLRLGAFRLTKNLPVASGIGGGSSDAAAALRLIARLNGIDTDDQRLTDAARTLGADVPVCLDPTAPRLMHGIGHELGNRLYGLRYPAVLVNPVLPLETRAVFAGLGLSPGDRFVPMKGHAPCDLKALIGTRNDLEGPAKAIVPEIEDVLVALRESPGCRFARMSGSGATCFAIFDHYGEGAEAAARLQVEREWWARPTWLKLPS